MLANWSVTPFVQNFLTYLQVDHRYRYLEAEMLDWAERNWAGDKAAILTQWSMTRDIERQKLLTQRGYENWGAIEDVRIQRSLTDHIPWLVYLQGSRLLHCQNMAISKHGLIWKIVYGAKSLYEAWFKGKSSAPSYSSKWDLIPISPMEN